MAPKAVMSMADWRLQVVQEPGKTGRSVQDVCESHEISRDTFYRWKRGFEAAGVTGLLDRSRAPINQPRKIPAEMEERICQMRRQHPRWGARTIHTKLKGAGEDPPCITTIHRVLCRNGLVVDDPAKKPRVALKRFERDAPNDLWQMDSKQFPLEEGGTADVINILDDHARFMLAGLACCGSSCEANWQTFSDAARRYGLPRQLYTDNHMSFTGRLYGKEVEFERKVKAVGVKMINGKPHHPQGRGKIERFHKTMKEFVEDAGGAKDLQHLQQLVDLFQDEYNNLRPHQAIGDIPPSKRYRPSSRALGHDETLQDPEYPPEAIVRKAAADGVICFNYMKISLGRRWGGRKVRVQPDDEGIHVYFGDDLLRSVTPHPDKSRYPLPKSRGKERI